MSRGMAVWITRTCLIAVISISAALVVGAALRWQHWDYYLAFAGCNFLYGMAMLGLQKHRLTVAIKQGGGKR